MARIEDFLSRHAADDSDRIAVVCGGESITYGQLYERSMFRAKEIQADNRKAVFVKTTQAIDFIITYFACHISSTPIVPLEYGIPDKRFEEITGIVDGSTVPEDIADILFTTGTTGKQKGTMLSHDALFANADNLVNAQQFTRDLSFIISGPLNHIGSLSKIWPMIIVGGTIIVTEGMKDIDALFGVIDAAEYKVATFLVPASLRILLALGKDRLAGYSSKIDFIETGAAPMAQSDMEELCRILPYTRLYNTYASTETGIIATHDYCNDDCIAGCLGRPMKHSSISILSDGKITCSGATLMSGYVGDPVLTQEILHDGVLYTSDLGHFDEKGRLRLDGRVTEVINVGGYKVMPIEVENVVMAFPGISDCICIRGSHPVIGDVLKLIYVVSDDSCFSRNSMISYLKTHLEPHKVPVMYEQADKIQRTYNGKLNRKYYDK